MGFDSVQEARRSGQGGIPCFDTRKPPYMRWLLLAISQ